MKQLFVAIVLVAGLFSLQIQAQDTLRNKKGGNYLFSIQKDIEAGKVQNQQRTSTCWSFSALSFMESELLRMGKGEHNLSEMFVVRMAYEAKAERYVRMNGAINFAQGGAFHDIPFVISNFGIVPEEVYTGLQPGEDVYNHGELEAVLKGMLDGVIKNRQGKLTNNWKKALKGVLDAYLGEVPERFSYRGKTYNPKSFAEELGLDMNDYITLSSYTHHPFYSSFVLEVPDNWMMERAWNVPLDEFQEVMEKAVMEGYSIAWAADVSEKGFSFRDGLAIIPEDESKLVVKGKDSKGFNDAGAVKEGSQFDSPGHEKQIDQQMRQQAFDNYQTTDDHGMHITGLVKDQNGKSYFIVKNSWGTANDCDGYFYASVPYIRYKTMDIMLHKDALDKSLIKKLGL